MLEALIALAALAGNTIVAAATTDAWEAARRQFARLLGRGDPKKELLAEKRLEQTRQQLDGVSGQELQQAHVDLARAWQVRLTDLLEEDPGVEAELRAPERYGITATPASSLYWADLARSIWFADCVTRLSLRVPVTRYRRIAGVCWAVIIVGCARCSAGVIGVQIMALSRSVRWRTSHVADLARQVMAHSASQSPACGVTLAHPGQFGLHTGAQPPDQPPQVAELGRADVGGDLGPERQHQRRPLRILHVRHVHVRDTGPQ
jgi:hypothetical protein